MLVLSKLHAGDHLYFLATAEGSGRAGIEPPGRWIGGGASSLGLSGTVEGDGLQAVLDGRHPSGGGPLGADRRQVTVVGYDLIFCAPKSVSLLHALGPPEVTAAVRVGHEQAVEAALAYVESHALAVRRPVPGAARVSGARPVPMPVECTPSATFVHRTSRALDPHLHSHVLVANVGRGPEGRWSALDGRGVYAHGATVGALYQAHLRHELTSSLGVGWGPLRGGRADIAGIGVEARAEFSRRSAAVLAHLAEQGLILDGRASRRASQVAALATRTPKDLATSAEALLPWWRERARAVGLGAVRLEALLGRVPPRSLRQEVGLAPNSDVDQRLWQRAMAESLGAIRDAGQPFARRHLVRGWASSRPLGAPAAEVEERVDRFLGSDGVRGDDRRPRVASTQAGVAEGRHVLDERLLALEKRTTLELDRSRDRRVGWERADTGIDLGL